MVIDRESNRILVQSENENRIEFFLVKTKTIIKLSVISNVTRAYFGDRARIISEAEEMEKAF